ncbi:zinc finger protein 615 isoform X2 [Bombina bombina]|uniref:zinc finger protein 615 isoform X2 n=1 Tax=Bombina bombina TaxID=8345 RepID=UPI00235AC914|nr:zinc finger protein 615 isoform X2 [Bombina bombina]
MKNIMTERILNHALEIIYLLTGEISVFQDLVNSLIINDTSKDRKRTTERIVTHALEIISLLTGEVPIKCDDVAVYFTIEEWAFIEGHKEFYKDLVLENEESHRTLCISSSNSSGLEREHLDTDSAVAAAQEEEEERDTDVQQLDIRAETCAGEDLKTKQTEDLCASSDLQDLKQEICERLTTNLPEGNLQTECVNEEEEEEIDEKDILQIQIDSDSFSGDDYADDVVNAELTKDLGLNGPIKCIKQEDCEDIGSDGHLNSLSKKVRGKVSERNLINKSTLFGKINPSSTAALYQYEQKTNTSIKYCNVVSLETRKPEAAHCEIQVTKILVGKDSQALHITENSHPSNKNIKSKPPNRTLAGEKPYICQACGKGFSDRYNMVEHERIHTGEKPYVCLECLKCFNRKSNLVAHQRTHTGDKPHVCPECSKGFSTRPQLVAHLRTHTGERPYTCQKCGKGYYTKGHLVSHYRTHTQEKPYVCQTCGKGFSQKSSLDGHLRTHTGEKPFVCQICGKGFSEKSNMVTHQRTHTGEKPYVCQTCRKCFTDKSTLNAHRRLHTGEKPYVCQLCGKGFAQRAGQIAHHRTHMREKALT